MSDRVRGVWCATLTPLDAHGNVDTAAFRDHARHLLREGVDGIAPFGTTGEGQSFSVAERRAGVEALLAAGIDPRRIAPATGCASLRETIELTRHAVHAGCAGVLVLPPFFFKGVGDDGVFASFAGLIEAVNDTRLRVYLYHIPQVSGIPIGPGALERLVARFPQNIVGVKDSAGDLEHSLALARDFPSLDILVGHEPHMPRVMAAGGAGTICGLANLYPRVIRRLHDARDEAARAQALAIAERVIAAVVPRGGITAIKGIMSLQTGDRRWLAVREPLRPIDDAALAALAQKVTGLGAQSAVLG